jgi:hypothetical protein
MLLLLVALSKKKEQEMVCGLLDTFGSIKEFPGCPSLPGFPNFEGGEMKEKKKRKS